MGILIFIHFFTVYGLGTSFRKPMLIVRETIIVGNRRTFNRILFYI